MNQIVFSCRVFMLLHVFIEFIVQLNMKSGYHLKYTFIFGLIYYRYVAGCRWFRHFDVVRCVDSPVLPLLSAPWLFGHWTFCSNM